MEIVGWIKVESGGESWEEWCIKTSENEIWWLNSYNNHFHLYYPARDEPSTSLRTLDWKDTFTLSGRSYTVYEQGTAKILDLKGELPWDAEKGETYPYMDAVHAPHRVTVEFDDDEEEIFDGLYLEPETVWELFSVPGSAPEPIGDVPSRPEPDWWSTFFIPGLLCSFVFLAAYVLSFWYQDAVPIKGYRVDLKPVIQKTQKGQMHILEGFQLKNAPDLMKITLVTHPKNAWAWVRFGIIDENDQLLVSFSELSEYYSGVTNGEHWTEDRRFQDQLLRLEKSGTYRIGLQAERDDWRGGDPPEVARIGVMRNAFASRYYLYSFVLVFLVPFYIIVRKFFRYNKFWSE